MNMKNENHNHLSDELILRAIIDEADLNPAEQFHLSTCSICRKRKTVMEAPLIQLGQLAAQHAPDPKGYPSILHNRPSRRVYGWNFGWRPALASAVSILLIVAWAWGYGAAWFRGTERVDTARLEKIDDATLMAEVDALIDEALPETYRYITADDEPRLTDEFIRFVAPLAESDSLTFNFRNRGLTLWQTSV